MLALGNEVRKEILRNEYMTENKYTKTAYVITHHNDIHAAYLLNPKGDLYIFTCIIMKGLTGMLKTLLKRKKINPSIGKGSIGSAAKFNRLEIVRLLLEDGRVNPKHRHNYAIRVAAENGFKEIVQLLLTDKRVNPSDDDNYAITYASINGHIEVVRMLLADDRVKSVDFTDDNNDYIRPILRLGEQGISILNLLMTSKKVKF
jgi:hypothetical protein